MHDDQIYFGPLHARMIQSTYKFSSQFPYMPNRQVMRIHKIINMAISWILAWFTNKFSEPNFKRNVWQSLMRANILILGLERLNTIDLLRFLLLSQTCVSAFLRKATGYIVVQHSTELRSNLSSTPYILHYVMFKSEGQILSLLAWVNFIFDLYCILIIFICIFLIFMGHISSYIKKVTKRNGNSLA